MDKHDDIDMLASDMMEDMFPPRLVGHENLSMAWTHFNKMPNPNPLSKANCKNFRSLIRHNNVTSSMLARVERCERKYDNVSKKQKSYSSTTSFYSPSFTMIDQEATNFNGFSKDHNNRKPNKILKYMILKNKKNSVYLSP